MPGNWLQSPQAPLEQREIPPPKNHYFRDKPAMTARKRIIIDPTVQWTLARRIVFHWIVFFLLLFCINVGLRVVLESSDRPLPTVIWDAVVAQAPLVCVMLLVLPVFTRDTLHLSHRFTGPMYRLRISLATLGDGLPMSPIKFRTDDFWQEVAEKFNCVRDRICDLEARNRQLEHEVRRLNESLRQAHEETATV